MNQNKKHSVFFRGIVIAVAFLLAVLCFPINGIVALASDGDVDYHFITIGNSKESVQTEVLKGDTYTIPVAYIGGNTGWKVGDSDQNNQKLATEGEQQVTLVSSNISVSILGEDVRLNEDNKSFNFKVEKEGTYQITYSYNYKIGEKGEEQTNSYKLNVVSKLPKASVNFVDTSIPLPSSIDLSLAHSKEDKNTYIDMNIPLPEIHDDKDEKIEGVAFYTTKTLAEAEAKVGQEGGVADKYVLITANGGHNAKDVEVSEENGRFFISGSVFSDKDYLAGLYTIRYSYYVRNASADNGKGVAHFVTSASKTTTVFTDDGKHNHYKNYDIKLDLDSDWIDNGQTGVESKLPKAIGLTSADTTPANEQVDVAYNVKVFFKTTREGQYNTEIKDIKVNPDDKDSALLYADQLNADGTLKDPTKFTPLQDGYYSFIYTIRDYYGNERSNLNDNKYAYEFKGGDGNNGVKDQKAPTAIVYDASSYDENDEYVDEAYKSKSYSVANGVVVYAIGMTDNVSKYNTPGVDMYREIMLDEEETVLTIKDYDKYNLVFNYRETGANSAYDNLITNDYNIRKQINAEGKQIKSDKDMLDWLKEKRYLIVVDNKNSDEIYKTFKSASVFGESITDGNTLVSWLKTQTPEEIAKLGFAYIDSDKTFGSNQNGDLGNDDYVIHYVVKDAAGNTSTHRTVSMTIVSTLVDNDAPQVVFSTGLKDSYLPNTTLTFNAPSWQKESYDNRMQMHTLYRYLYDESVSTGKFTGDKKLDEVWKAIDKIKDDNGVLLTEKYKTYNTDSTDGYTELTDTDASSYTIDLSEAGEKVTGLQIFVYVFDDAGNVGIYAKTVTISSVIDSFSPSLHDVIDNETAATYEQGTEIALPTLEFYDDAVGFMTYDIAIECERETGSLPIHSTGSHHERKVANGTIGTYKVYGGRFVASYEGTYHVTISVSDGNNNTIAYFKTYKVEPRVIIQPPVINPSFAKNQTVELDTLTDGIEIPVPVVNYEIPRSVTYDVYTAEDTKTNYTAGHDGYNNTDYVVLGVNENNLATNWSATYGTENVFRPTKTGTYDFVFTVDLIVYNYKTMKYQEMTVEADESTGMPTYKEGGYIEYTNKDKTAKIYAADDNSAFKVVSSEKTYFVVNDENGFKIFKEGESGLEEFNSKSVEDGWNDSIFAAEGAEDAFKELKHYKLESDVYRVVVQDSTAPELIDYDYPTALTKDAEGKVGALTIYGIQVKPNATGIDDIDRDRSQIVLSWTLASAGSTGSVTGRHVYSLSNGKDNNPFEDHTFDSFPDNSDGIYKVTYNVYDTNGNAADPVVYEIAVGDNIGPEMSFEEFEIKDSYKLSDLLKSPLKVDLSAIDVIDLGSDEAFEFPRKATLTNKSTGEEIKPDEELSKDDQLFFNIDEVGTYSLVVEVTDAVGNKSSQTFSFEVTAETRDGTTTYQVIGTVLIVISVLILAGVIIYFIVSKVKLDKELKK